MKLVEHTDKLVYKGNIQQMKATLLKMMTDKLEIDHNIFNAIMKTKIISKVDSALINVKMVSSTSLKGTHQLKAIEATENQYSIILVLNFDTR